MFVTPDRAIYLGLLGAPSVRNLGGLTIYVSLGQPFRLCLDGTTWTESMLAVIAPYCPHQIVSRDRSIGAFNIEAETIDMQGLPCFLRPAVRVDPYNPDLAGAREVFLRLIRGELQGELADLDVDCLFLNQPLPQRSLDPRIAWVIAQIKEDPSRQDSAAFYAREVGLSLSRFIHLFNAEVGVTFRRFRAWKRARSFMLHVNSAPNLTALALDIGYPDSSHFSHSIRRFFGLTPTSICAGSQRLDLTVNGTAKRLGACSTAGFAA